VKDSSTAGTAATAMLSLLSTWSRRSPTRARRGGTPTNTNPLLLPLSNARSTALRRTRPPTRAHTWGDGMAARRGGQSMAQARMALAWRIDKRPRHPQSAAPVAMWWGGRGRVGVGGCPLHQRHHEQSSRTTTPSPHLSPPPSPAAAAPIFFLLPPPLPDRSPPVLAAAGRWDLGFFALRSCIAELRRRFGGRLLLLLH